MTVATASRTIPSGLAPGLRTAQAAMQLPEVQDMLRRLSEFQLGIFMPHRHDEASGELLALPDNMLQVESGLSVSFQRLDAIVKQTASFLPVGWLWRGGGLTLASACEMADADSAELEMDRTIRHKMPEHD